MITDRFILVVGMPRGGTSVVTRMLIALGVNMGEELTSNPYYQNAEDQGLMRACGQCNPINEQAAQKTDRYMRERIDQVDGPVGGKYPIITNLSDTRVFKRWPVAVVYVKRPLDEVIASDNLNYAGKRGAPGKVKRAAYLGGVWWRQRVFLEHHEPVVSIDFKDLRENPLDVIDSLALKVCGKRLELDELKAVRDEVVRDPSEWRAHDAAQLV
jgi:hypothetical protein